MHTLKKLLYLAINGFMPTEKIQILYKNLIHQEYSNAE
tara:strand:+ start:785 stop:898 length:114 start_codon:yes stop_codon:yes gene_type:complete